MLNIYYGDIPKEMEKQYIYNTNVYFDNIYKDKWIGLPLVREMIQSVDKSEVVDEKTIDSPIFGKMSPKKLSGGVKTLILINCDKTKVYNASTCGDNCAQWILKMAEDRKIVIGLRHLMDFGPGEFKIRVMNTGVIVHNMAELVTEAGRFV